MTTTDTPSTWVVVLAAGDGRRLQSLTRTENGVAVPKQFCSLRGTDTLLEQTLDRAYAIADRDRVVTVVAQDHEPFWRPLLAELPRRNIVVQPRNRGTGNGILLPLLAILDRDPEARIVILPSDHHVRYEGVLQARIHHAAIELAQYRREIVLLGIEPDELDPELGYIRPGPEERAGFRTVQQFVEKPRIDVARALLQQGGVWNSFIMAARGQALLDLYASRFPEVVLGMVAALRTGAPAGALARLYAALPDIDFSRHVIADRERWLRLLTVPACGWSDLGTPERVVRCLERLPAPQPSRIPAAGLPGRVMLSLALTARPSQAAAHA